MIRSLLIQALEEIKSGNASIEPILKEVRDIEANPEKVKEAKSLEPYTLGCEYKRGAFIIDSNNSKIYKREFPAYFGFLYAWIN